MNQLDTLAITWFFIGFSVAMSSALVILYFMR